MPGFSSVVATHGGPLFFILLVSKAFFFSVLISSGDNNAPRTHFETSWGNVSVVVVVVDLDVGPCPDQIRTRRRAGAGSCWRRDGGWVVAQQKSQVPLVALTLDLSRLTNGEKVVGFVSSFVFCLVVARSHVGGAS